MKPGVVLLNADRGGIVKENALLEGHRITIRSFEFSHSAAHERSMFLIRVGKDVPDIAMQQLRDQPNITLVRRIVI